MASQPRKVLLAIDASHHSEEAVHFYFNNCFKPEQDFLYVVHVVAHHPHMFHRKQDYEEALNDINHKANILLENYNAKLKILLPEDRFEVALLKEMDGGVGHTLCQTAQDHDISLIIMSRRGLGLIRRSLMGSVSDYVLHHAHIPTIVVPPCKCQVAQTEDRKRLEEEQRVAETWYQQKAQGIQHISFNLH
ncbi:uncharacterized protein LOC116619923 [Nematostella vectensis]|uniref:uncharacterized protein LOC116619923 n=1 Tax=Nematostella vectensis TaxID=45351 RepID=UPI002076E38F|nr:uncharacterized protein LOC116619923 [Nematostella vectensis]